MFFLTPRSQKGMWSSKQDAPRLPDSCISACDREKVRGSLWIIMVSMFMYSSSKATRSQKL
jgi:hypothetical protein